MNWSEGYRTEINYTHGYYGEMNTASMQFLLLAAGFNPPAIASACELGFGQGVSLNIHAAAEPVVWTGTDFNPDQVVFARELAAASGARCFADSFHDFCERTDLPEFDFIALHGIWSWISKENQQNIVRLIDKKLRVGGVLYISYNTNPGWAVFKPARDLMYRYIKTLASESEGQKAADAFAFMEKLLNLNTAFGSANPQALKRVESFKGKDSSYLVHEFFNEIWEPCSFANMDDMLGEARMKFACSAQPLLINRLVGLSAEQRDFIKDINDPVIRETVLDFIRNTQFRKDYWVKGSRQSGSMERASALRKQQVILLARPDKITEEIKTPMGNVKIAPATLQVFSAVLADGHPHTLEDLEKAARALAAKPDAPDGAAAENIWSITQAVCVFLSAGYVGIAQKPEDIQKAKQPSDKLNKVLENMALQDGLVNFLASPVTGGGISVGRFDMLFLLAMRRGSRTADSMGAFARDCLVAAGQRIIKDGKQVESAEDTLAYLREQAAIFIADKLSILKNLHIA